MLLDLYILFTVLTWLTLFAGLVVGLFRGELVTGKGMAVMAFILTLSLSTMLAFESLHVEVVECAATCVATSYAYENLTWVNAGIAVVSAVLAMFFGFATFGAALPGKRR